MSYTISNSFDVLMKKYDQKLEQSHELVIQAQNDARVAIQAKDAKILQAIEHIKLAFSNLQIENDEAGSDGEEEFKGKPQPED